MDRSYSLVAHTGRKGSTNINISGMQQYKIIMFFLMDMENCDIVAEWSKAIRLGRISFESVGSNPTDVTYYFFSLLFY
jgi:hypothetical protein